MIKRNKHFINNLPVGMPQPSKQTLSNGAESAILQSEISATTVY